MARSQAWRGRSERAYSSPRRVAAFLGSPGRTLFSTQIHMSVTSRSFTFRVLIEGGGLVRLWLRAPCVGSPKPKLKWCSSRRAQATALLNSSITPWASVEPADHGSGGLLLPRSGRHGAAIERWDHDPTFLSGERESRRGAFRRSSEFQTFRRAAASFAFNETIGLSTIGSTRRRIARYRLT